MKTAFEHIVGNDRIKEYLSNLVERQSTVQSLLFAGPDGIGKGLFAHAFAELILCSNDPEGKKKLALQNHLDLHVYRPEGKIGMHSMESMRTLIRDVYLPPCE